MRMRWEKYLSRYSVLIARNLWRIRTQLVVTFYFFCFMYIAMSILFEDMKNATGFTETSYEFTSALPIQQDLKKTRWNIPMLKIKQTTTPGANIQQSAGERGHQLRQRITKTPIESRTNQNKLGQIREILKNPTTKANLMKVSHNASKKTATVLSRSLFTADRDSVELFSYWREEGEVMCETGSLFEYYPSHVRIRDILLDRHHARAPPGGENVTDVLNQTEATEFLKLTPGFFQVGQGSNLVSVTTKWGENLPKYGSIFSALMSSFDSVLDQKCCVYLFCSTLTSLAIKHRQK